MPPKTKTRPPAAVDGNDNSGGGGDDHSVSLLTGPPPDSSRVHSVNSSFDYNDPSTVVHVLNPDIGSSRSSIVSTGTSAISDSSQLQADFQRVDAPPPSSAPLSHGLTGVGSAHVSEISHADPSQVLTYTPVPARRHPPSGEIAPMNVSLQAPAEPLSQIPQMNGAVLATLLQSSYTPDVISEMLTQLHKQPSAIPSHTSERVVVNLVSSDSSSSPERQASSVLVATSAQGRKRDTPGNPSSSSSSADSAPQPPIDDDRGTSTGGAAATQPMVSPRSARLAISAGAYPPRCPVCLLFIRDLGPNHNPYNCVRSTGARSVLEDQQLSALYASRRILSNVGLGGPFQSRYNYDADSAAEQAAPTQPEAVPIVGPPSTVNLSSRQATDPRVQQVREDERAGYAAGVDLVASESRSRDTSAHGSYSRSQRSSSTSSYAPSSSVSSSESVPPSWALALTSRIDQMASTLTDLARIQSQHNDIINRTPAYMQQPPGWQQQPPFMVPGFPPGASYMPGPMGFIPPPQQDPYMPAPSRSSLNSGLEPPYVHSQHHSVAHDRSVSFTDQVGTVSPSMLHTARPRGGMRGAPELAPEDIGNVAKFNEFLQRHASYAASAREQNQSWASVSGLLSRYAEDLAVAFNACALKRRDPPNFDSHTVLQLSDDVFERLYLEACAPSVEYPSQVLQLLESIAFIRQQPHESSPMPAILRAAEAFRVQLRLLPSRVVNECKDDALAMSFMALLFKDSAKHRANDFQRCTTWVHLKDALISVAASNPNWFGTALLPSSDNIKLPLPLSGSSQQSASSSSVSQAPVTAVDPVEAKKLADRVAKMRSSGELKGLEIEGLSDKKIVKLVNKMKWRSKIGDQAVQQARAAGSLQSADTSSLQKQLQQQADAISALTAQLTRQRSDSRDRRDDRSRDDRPRDDHYRDNRSRDDRSREDRPRSQSREPSDPKSPKPPAPASTLPSTSSPRQANTGRP
jgi:hypothetical protein